MCFEDVVWLEGEGTKKDEVEMGDLDQLCEREHDCTNMLQTAVKNGFLIMIIIFIIANIS